MLLRKAYLPSMAYLDPFQNAYAISTYFRVQAPCHAFYRQPCWMSSNVLLNGRSNISVVYHTPLENLHCFQCSRLVANLRRFCWSVAKSAAFRSCRHTVAVYGEWLRLNWWNIQYGVHVPGLNYFVGGSARHTVDLAVSFSILKVHKYSSSCWAMLCPRIRDSPLQAFSWPSY